MSTLACEIKTTMDKAAYCFNLSACPKKLRSFFNEVLDSHSDTLNLSDKGISKQDIPCILRFLNAYPHITVLDLSNNDIGKQVPNLALNHTLRTLKLNSCCVRCIGCVALGKNTTLTALELRDNELEDQDVNALAKSTTLKVLDLSCNLITVQGTYALAENPSIISLDVSYNINIKDQGAEALLKSNTLIALNLCQVDVHDRALQDIATNSTLVNLNISGNFITNTGVLSLIENQSIQILDVSENKRIGENAALALIEFSQSSEKQKLAFLMGMHPSIGINSAVLTYAKNALCDQNVLRELFSFLKPSRGIMSLKHTFPVPAIIFSTPYEAPNSGIWSSADHDTKDQAENVKQKLG
jgi:Leucine-rich repeat (LRR) protein